MDVDDIPGVDWDPRHRRDGRPRVLFYGGCHAQIIVDAFRRYALDAEVAFDCLVNYQIIADGIPFPRQRLGTWQAIAYSPIVQQPGYETAPLRAAAQAAGVRPVAFPWMEWHGTFPHMAKGRFLGREAWHYPFMLEPRLGALDFAAYLAELDRIFADPGMAAGNLGWTTDHLRRQEQDNGCEVIISDLILAEFRAHRLFQTPDHPTRRLYGHTVRQLAALLRLPVAEGYFALEAEPQDGEKLPIAPALGPALGLRFTDATYRDIAGPTGPRTLGWEDYARLAHGQARGEDPAALVARLLAEAG